MSKPKKKPMWCQECKRQTPHVYVGKETPYNGFLPARALALIVTLGMSETAWVDRFWQCENCGNIKKVEG